VGDLPVLLGSRPKCLDESILRDIEKTPQEPEKSPSDDAPGRRRQPPAPLEFSGESECPERDELWFFVKNTFLEGSRVRSPSLERFYKERSVHTCPSHHIGKLRQLETETPQSKENTVRIWEGLPSPSTGFETPILEDLPVLFGRGGAAPAATTFSSSASSGTAWTAPMAPPPYPPPELDPLADAATSGPPMSLLSTQPPADQRDRVAASSPVLTGATAAPTMSMPSLDAASWDRPWDSPTPSFPWEPGHPYIPDHSYLHGSPQTPWTGQTGESMSFPYTPYFPLGQANLQPAVDANSMHAQHQQHSQQQHHQHHAQQSQQHQRPTHQSKPQAEQQQPKQVLNLSAALDWDEMVENWWPQTAWQQPAQPSTAAANHTRELDRDYMLPPKPQSAAALGARSIEALLHPGGNAASAGVGASRDPKFSAIPGSQPGAQGFPTIPGISGVQQGPGTHALQGKTSQPDTASTVSSWRGPVTTAAQAPLTSNAPTASPITAERYRATPLPQTNEEATALLVQSQKLGKA